MLLLVTATDGWWDCGCDEGPLSQMLLARQRIHQRQHWREEVWVKKKSSPSFYPHILSSIFPLHLSSSSSSSSPSAAVSLDTPRLSVHQEASDIILPPTCSQTKPTHLIGWHFCDVWLMIHLQWRQYRLSFRVRFCRMSIGWLDSREEEDGAVSSHAEGIQVFHILGRNGVWWKVTGAQVNRNTDKLSDIISSVIVSLWSLK